ncbi:MAG: FAD-binding oxidoreductase [Caulobacteraceae bacterium]|nr:FAD-binding oxidoreductase [Caulobacter sp.]
MVSQPLDDLKAAAGPGGWSDDPEVLASRLVEWRGRWTGRTPLLLRPRTTAEVSRVVAVAARTRTALTVRGGGTGLVGGQAPDGEVLLSLERMTALREVCAEGDVLVAEAGATLDAVQAAAEAADRSFPVGLASGGSATVGGMVATNAGGVSVLRYGSMREQVLGLEAVLADGSVWNGLSRLRKDNTGYDLRGLLIGAEGTLGVVTAASLRLRPRLADRAVALAGVASPEAALALLHRVQAEAAGRLEAFELISGAGLGLALRHLPGSRPPLAAPHPWLVLVEIAAARTGEAQALLEGALAQGVVVDAALAASEAQRHALWALREGQSAAQKAEGPAWKHDVSVPVAAVPEFLRRAGEAVERLSPGARVVAFGHVGDGNIHYDVLAPPGADPAGHMDKAAEAMRAVHDVVHALGGSISAEHGLGVLKTAEALRYKDPVAVAAMRAIRAALDPHRILNPRVLF